LESTEAVELVALFGPEHGFSGSFQAGEIVENGPRVFSLYGEQRAPTKEMLSDVDVLIYDIQDVGSRFYTYISTLFESMKAAASHNIPIMVLDRPNPLGGERVEGPVVDSEFFTFVGIFSIPIRYGLTVGELALFFNSEAGINADLTVVRMTGWDRDTGYPEKWIQWISPSPNMPTVRTAQLYPGFCLIEGTNLSEGRGTTRPFELVGAPWLDAEKLAKKLNELRIPGVWFRPQQFSPTFSKYEGENCSGIQIHVLDAEQFNPVYSALALISQTIRLHPEELKFRDSHFDRLIGNSWVREWLIKGDSVESIQSEFQERTRKYERDRQKYFLY
jgi:beta-N-acetylhexosaminidase